MLNVADAADLAHEWVPSLKERLLPLIRDFETPQGWWQQVTGATRDEPLHLHVSPFVAAIAGRLCADAPFQEPLQQETSRIESQIAELHSGPGGARQPAVTMRERRLREV